MDFILIICLALFLLTILWGKSRKCNRIVDAHGKLMISNDLHLFHLSGVFILGIIPLLNYERFPFGINPAHINIQKWLIVILATGLAGWISYVAAGKVKFSAEKSLNLAKLRKYIGYYLFLRIIYILAYETFFRGWLFEDSIDRFGLWPAVGLNVLLYAGFHIPNGRNEAIATIPFGLVMCLLVWWSGSVIPAICLHLVLSLVFDYKILRKLTEWLHIQSVHGRPEFKR